nr:hypothetical protein [Comamonas jiangduensis]
MATLSQTELKAMADALLAESAPKRGKRNPTLTTLLRSKSLPLKNCGQKTRQKLQNP